MFKIRFSENIKNRKNSFAGKLFYFMLSDMIPNQILFFGFNNLLFLLYTKTIYGLIIIYGFINELPSENILPSIFNIYNIIICILDIKKFNI